MARPADIGEVVDLLSGVSRPFANGFGRRGDPKAAIEKMLADCQKHRSVLVAEAHRQIIGFVHLQLLFSFVEGGWLTVVDSLAVRADWQGRAVERLMLSRAEEWSIQRGAQKLQIWVAPEDPSIFSLIDRQYWHKEEKINLYRWLSQHTHVKSKR
jgi:GNAT superfamily N-acetyltransferase